MNPPHFCAKTRCDGHSTRLWLGDAIGVQRDRRLITSLIEKVRACALARPLLICVDGLSTYATAIGQVFRSPWPTGKPGRPRLIAWPDLHIGQVIKQYEKKRVVGVVQRMARGSLETAQVLLEKSRSGRHLNMAFIERLNGTFRSRSAPLARRTRSLVRTAATLGSAMYLIGCVYNFCADHKSLRLPGVIGGRREWLPRTPAMAAGIADHRWTVKELLSYRVPPPPWTPPKQRGRPSKAIQAL